MFLTSDHGEGFGGHAFYFHGNTLFDELVRVPLIVKLSGGADAGSRVDGPVSMIDIAPTIAGFAGVDASKKRWTAAICAAPYLEE